MTESADAVASWDLIVLRSHGEIIKVVISDLPYLVVKELGICLLVLVLLQLSVTIESSVREAQVCAFGQDIRAGDRGALGKKVEVLMGDNHQIAGYIRDGPLG